MLSPSTLPSASIELLARGLHGDPFAVLGPHDVAAADGIGLVIRAFRPHAAQIAVQNLASGMSLPMTRLHPEGVFELFVPGVTRVAFDYRLRITWKDGSFLEIDDPY